MGTCGGGAKLFETVEQVVVERKSVVVREAVVVVAKVLVVALALALADATSVLWARGQPCSRQVIGTSIKVDRRYFQRWRQSNLRPLTNVDVKQRKQGTELVHYEADHVPGEVVGEYHHHM